MTEKKLDPDIWLRARGEVRKPMVKVPTAVSSAGLLGSSPRKPTMLKTTKPATISNMELLNAMMSVSCTMLAKREL